MTDLAPCGAVQGGPRGTKLTLGSVHTPDKHHGYCHLATCPAARPQPVEDPGPDRRPLG
ncbi:hypothetical protein THIX_90058 [Thiomonas sp. X19]|nr:hypothetical protein THIX_90058 [Thiomonas sp. X19]